MFKGFEGLDMSRQYYLQLRKIPCESRVTQHLTALRKGQTGGQKASTGISTAQGSEEKGPRRAKTSGSLEGEATARRKND